MGSEKVPEVVGRIRVKGQDSGGQPGMPPRRYIPVPGSQNATPSIQLGCHVGCPKKTEGSARGLASRLRWTGVGEGRCIAIADCECW